MARGELMKKLLASYGRDDEFRAVAEQIITEEEKKNNLALAKTLRKTLEGGPSRPSAPKALAPLLPFPEAASDFIEQIEPQHTKGDIVLSATNVRVLLGLVKEFRRGEDLRRHGLQTRSKVLFCGPPGCGKTLCAEIFAAELGLPFFVVKLDRLISSYLGETASNIRKILSSRANSPVSCSSTSSMRLLERVTTAVSTMSCAGS
ncbi:AAA family ATPase (plasmid) [Rhizobium ruizarguesonis]|uniref:AAA family ATPase n=1 Tax=Rhizobium ruizarguesonis TaxID=2081791 RepID=A0ACD5EGS7_9HYPH